MLQPIVCESIRDSTVRTRAHFGGELEYLLGVELGK